MSLSIGTLVGYLQLDDTQFNRKADAADKKLNGLRLHLEALDKTNPKVRVEVETATAKLDELKVRIADLKEQAARGIDVRVEMVEALIKLDALQAKIRSLHNAEIKVHVDDKTAIDKLEAIQKRVDGLGSKGGLLGSALAFGPAFLPAINALPGTLFAIGSGAVATAGGVGVLALAFHGLGDSVKAYSDYEAKLPFAKNAKQIAELKKQLALSAYGEQNTAGREFTRTVATKGQSAASGIKSSAQAGVFPGATRALNDIIPLVPVVERLMKSLGTTVGDMTDETAKALNSPFWRQWFHWLGEDAKTQLPLVGSIFGHTFEGIMRAIQRFAPEGTSLLTWIDDLAKRFDAWTGSPAFETFMENTATNGHAAVDALSSFAKVFGQIYKGLSGAGLAELQVFGHVMEGISHLPVGVLQAIGAALPIIFLGLKGIALTNSMVTGLQGLGGAFTGLRGKISSTGIEATSTQKAVAGLAGAGGLALLTMASQQSSESMGGLEGALGGAMTGFALTGNPIAALIGGVGGGLLGIFSAGHRAADGIDATTKAALESRGVIEQYKTSLDGLNAVSTHQTRTDILSQISKARQSKKDKDGNTVPGLLEGLDATDKQVLNAVLGRKGAYDKIFNAVEAPLVAAQHAVAAQQKAVAAARHNLSTASGIGKTDALNELNVQKKILSNLRGQVDQAQARETAQTGFIYALQTAQRELRKAKAEALTLQQLLKMGVPKPIAHLIDTNGVDQDVRVVAGLIDKFHIVDRTKWRAILSAEGLVPSRDMLQQITSLLHDAARDRTAKITLKVAGDVGLAAALGAFDGSDKTVKVKGKAAGGTVEGQRQPYGDKVLTPTAPGEEITPNDRGQADKNRAALKAGAAGATLAVVGPGMAGGGTVPDPLSGFGPEDVPGGGGGKGGTKGHHHKGPTKAQIKAAHDKKLRQQLAFVTNALSKTQAQLSAAQQWSSAFGGNVFGADLSAYMPKSAPVTSIVNGMRVVQSGGAAASTPQSTLTAMLAYQKAQRDQAVKLGAWVKKLRKEGVSSAVLSQMQAGGPQGIAEIQALASGSLAQVRQFNSLQGGTTAALNETGALATSGKHYSDLQKRQMNEASMVKSLSKVLHKPVPVRVVSGNLRP